jgi:hypothetical protein
MISPVPDLFRHPPHPPDATHHDDAAQSRQPRRLCWRLEKAQQLLEKQGGAVLCGGNHGCSGARRVGWERPRHLYGVKSREREKGREAEKDRESDGGTDIQRHRQTGEDKDRSNGPKKPTRPLYLSESFHGLARGTTPKFASKT